MNEHTMITARDPDIIAAEINTIKKNVQQIMIAGALEIGGKLVEAKGMVPHGQWGKWLEEKVSYSQSTANNMMRLYQEYGGDQQSLFDTWTNSQAFADMNYTQHLALLALPFAQRQEFAETHQVAEMSTRELEKKIREELAGEFAEQIAASEQRAAAAEERAFQAGAELQGAVEDRDKAQNAARDATAEADGYLRQKLEAEKAAQKAEKDKARAEKSEQNALSMVKKLEKQLDEAKASERAARDELQKAKDNPDVPDDVMAAMRKEAAQKAAEDLTAQLEAAKQAAAKAEQEKAAAEEAARAAAAKLEEAQKASRMADTDVMAIQALAQQMEMTWNTIKGHRMKIAEQDPRKNEGVGKFLRALLDKLGQDI